VLSFNTETKTKSPPRSVLRAPSRSAVYCHENLEAAISRSALFITWVFWQTPAERYYVLAGGSRWKRDVNSRPGRCADTLVRFAHVCQLRRKPVIGGSSIDYAATELNKGPRPFARTYMCRHVCAASKSDVNLHHANWRRKTLMREDL